MNLAVKMVAEDSDAYTIEGLAAPFGGPLNGKDLTRQFFSAKTDFALDWFPERPMLWEHGVDGGPALDPIGKVTHWEIKSDLGLWVKAQLDKSSAYWSALKQLIDQGKLFFSTSSIEHLVQASKSTGEILVWPWTELTLTTHPCNPLATLEATTKHYELAGIKSTKLAELKTMSESSDSSGGYNVDDNAFGATRSQFAYVDSHNRGHLPLHDAAHVRAAMSRFDQTSFESPASKKAAARKILSKASALNIDVSADSAVSAAAKSASVKDLPEGATLMGDTDGPYPEGSYEDLADDIKQTMSKLMGCYCYVQATFPGYAIVCCSDDDEGTQYLRVAYDLDSEGEPVLGSMERVTPAMVPLPMPQTDEAPLAIQSARLTEYAALVLDRTKGVSDRRIKEGRVLSESNRERLVTTTAGLEEALKSLRDLLIETTEPQSAQAASVDRTAELVLLKMWAEAMSD